MENIVLTQKIHGNCVFYPKIVGIVKLYKLTELFYKMLLK